MMKFNMYFHVRSRVFRYLFSVRYRSSPRSMCRKNFRARHARILQWVIIAFSVDYSAD